MEDKALCRVSVKLTPEVKDWYTTTAKTYGSMGMAQLMAFVLSTYVQQQQRAEVTKKLAEYVKSPEAEKLQQANQKMMQELFGQISLL